MLLILYTVWGLASSEVLWRGLRKNTIQISEVEIVLQIKDT